MHPPGAICRQLADIHPYLRLAWHGEERQNRDDLNAGSFCIVQLYHIKDSGTPDEQNTYFHFWNSPGTYYGPVFNKNGGLDRDWDPLFRVPIYVINLKSVGIPPEDVFSGKFLDKVREWLSPIQKRLVDSARARGLELDRQAQDVADEATDFLWKEANKPDAATVISAHKHNREDLKTWERSRERAKDLKNVYLPRGVKP